MLDTLDTGWRKNESSERVVVERDHQRRRQRSHRKPPTVVRDGKREGKNRRQLILEQIKLWLSSFSLFKSNLKDLWTCMKVVRMDGWMDHVPVAAADLNDCSIGLAVFSGPVQREEWLV